MATENYKPVIEILRFMTPFGVGHFSNDKKTYRKPVYIPKWENEVVWERDISHLLDIVDNTFYVGVWIDSWTEEGYKVDLSLSYSNRPNKVVKVKPLVNTISYVNGQALPDFFPVTDVLQNFTFAKKAKNVKLHYITTGHGGHSGGDEFVKIKNTVQINNDVVLDVKPWRNDCASFRRFNPTSGVWLRKDSAAYIDFESRKYKVKESTLTSNKLKFQSCMATTHMFVPTSTMTLESGECAEWGQIQTLRKSAHKKGRMAADRSPPVTRHGLRF